MAQQRQDSETAGEDEKAENRSRDLPPTTPDRSDDGRRFAERYREEKTELSPEEVSRSALQYHVYDIAYTTARGRSRTVRSVQAKPPTSYNDVPEDFLSFWDDEDHYAYNPDTQVLKSINRGGTNMTIAEGEKVRSLIKINYPTRAVVVGAVQDGVTVRVFYRSNQSGRIKTMDVEIDESSGRFDANEIMGEAVDRDQRVKLRTKWERDIETVGVKGQKLGKVVRVEFPRGHQYTLNIHGLTDQTAGEKVEERIRGAIAKKLHTSDLSIDVQHEGRIPDER